MNITEEQRGRVIQAMEILSEVDTGSDFEVACHSAGVLLGHSFNIYFEDEDKENAEYLIKEGLDDELW